jgi:hypothetical protein
MLDDDETVARLPPRLVSDIFDVFVYVVVLNLFVEYFPGVLSESFTLSLLTAVLLKAVLEVVFVIKKRVRRRLRRATTRIAKVLAALMLWLLLVASKFVVLKLVDIVFGSRVSLGGFISVTLLIIALMLSRVAVRWLLNGARLRKPRTGRST